MFPTFRRPMPFFETPGGASGGGGGAAPTATPPAAPAATPAAPPAPVVPPAAPPAADPDRITKLEKELSDARKEAAGYRTQSKGALAEIRKALAPLLGIEDVADAPADAASLLAKLQERDAAREKQLREYQVSNALQSAGVKHGADMDLLIPHLRGSAALEKLDLTAETFAKDVSEMVKGLLEKNPKLRATQVAARSSVDPGGAPPNVPQLTREQLTAMHKAGDAAGIEEARKKGQLDNLLHGRG